MMDVDVRPHVAILLATYNGGAFLGDQLESIAKQSHQDWSLWVGDDGSSDDTLDLVAAFAAAHREHKVTVIAQPGIGATQNFLSLAHNRNMPRSYIAFCDQDDAWLPQRLERGLNNLSALQGTPALCGGRTIITDQTLKRIAISPLFARPFGFANAIVQSFAGGNTMMLNSDALDLLRAAPEGLDVVTHDWWAYQLVSGAGGTVIYDPEPTVLYRQHGANQIGSNSGFAAQMHRLIGVLRGEFSGWNTRNLAALAQCHALLTPEAHALIERLNEMRPLRGCAGLKAFNHTGIYRQTKSGNMALKLAAALGKI